MEERQWQNEKGRNDKQLREKVKIEKVVGSMLSNIVHMSVLFYHRSWISYDMLAEVVLYLKK